MQQIALKMVNPFPWEGRPYAVSERSGVSGGSVKTFKIGFPTDEIPSSREWGTSGCLLRAPSGARER
jgi:hypothetical protein